MPKKNIHCLARVLLSCFLAGLVLVFNPFLAQAVTEANLTWNLSAVTRQQKIDEIGRLLGEISKEVERLAAEQKLTAQKSEASPVAQSASANNNSNSQIGTLANLPFGGFTIDPIIGCNCTDDYTLIHLIPAKPDLPDYIMYSPSKAITYAFGQIPKKGVNLLGTHKDDVVCLILSGRDCKPVGVGKDVVMVGTSGGVITSTQPSGGNGPSPSPQPPASTTPPTTPPDQCKRLGNPVYTFIAKGSGYYPANTAMEGGFFDRLGKPLNTLQDYLAGKASYVSVAMDQHTFFYGTELCIPELEQKYGRQIIFKVVDTGSAFTGMGTNKIDICTANEQASFDDTVNGSLTLVSSVPEMQ